MDDEKGYYHDQGDGNVHAHAHYSENAVPHSHGHTHTQTKTVLKRLARASGHLESIKRMVEDGRDCTEVLIQIAAVRAALCGVAKVILKDHLEHCVTDVDIGSSEAIKTLNDAIEKFI